MEKRSKKLSDFTRSLKSLDGVEFAIEIYPDGKWVAESKNVDGIITGGADVSELDETLKDAIFTYFDVPAANVKSGILQRGTIAYTERIGLSPEYQTV